MLEKLHLPIIPMAAMVIAVTATGCHRESKGSGGNARAAIESCDSLPVEVKKMVEAIAESDSGAFAELVAYPLERPYPLRTISGPEEMKAYYNRMVDDSLRNIVTHAGPERWSSNGWRGWTLDEGEYFYIDGTLYAMNYISGHERAERDSLRMTELASLPMEMRDGWLPVACMHDAANGTVFRIDSRLPDDGAEEEEADNNLGSRAFRMAYYLVDADLSGQPSAVVEGMRETEGSAGNISYIFRDGSGVEFRLDPYPADAPLPRLYIHATPATPVRSVEPDTAFIRLHHQESAIHADRLRRHGKEHRRIRPRVIVTDTVIELTPAYWRDFMD